MLFLKLINIFFFEKVHNEILDYIQMKMEKSFLIDIIL